MKETTCKEHPGDSSKRKKEEAAGAVLKFEDEATQVKDTD